MRCLRSGMRFSRRRVISASQCCASSLARNASVGTARSATAAERRERTLSASGSYDLRARREPPRAQQRDAQRRGEGAAPLMPPRGAP